MAQWSSQSQQLDTQTRRQFVLDLRKSGATYRQIADAAIERFGKDNLPKGWDCLYAAKDVKRELKKVQAVNEKLATDIRALELERLDAMLLALWPKARKGNESSIDRVLRIMKRRADLTGIDAPQVIEVHDWREEAQEKGVDVAKLFEQYAQSAYDAIVAAGNGAVDGGGVD